MKKKCAYCNEENRLTKEHVWPKCFLEKIENVTAKFSLKNQKVHGADYIIKDVCRKCNNEILSELDIYFCNLYDSYFKNIVWSSDQEIHFEYNYNLLSRVLLKIAYNTSRSGVSDPNILSKTAPYILGEIKKYPKLILIMEIISPTQITGIGTEGIKSAVLSPPTYRSALMKLTTPNGNKVLPRLVGVNSYYFHLLVIKSSFSQSIKSRITQEALNALSGAVCLDNKSEVTLKMSERDGFSSMAKRFMNHYEDYGKYFKSKKVKN